MSAHTGKCKPGTPIWRDGGMVNGHFGSRAAQQAPRSAGSGFPLLRNPHAKKKERKDIEIDI